MDTQQTDGGKVVAKKPKLMRRPLYWFDDNGDGSDYHACSKWVYEEFSPGFHHRVVKCRGGFKLKCESEIRHDQRKVFKDVVSAMRACQATEDIEP